MTAFMMSAQPNHLGLFTDLYQLTMAQTYLTEGMEDTAVFSLFVRRLPPQRNYLVACGLDSVLSMIEALSFSDDDLAYLRSLGCFNEPFLSWLRNFRFTGDIDAVPEGTPLFANEPILEIVAPLTHGQLIETLVMNQIHLQMVMATKAVRVVSAARGRRVIDFGARRMHGFDAAVKAARAFYIAGVHATSNVLAGKTYGIPVSGTMAHSYVQAHHDEREAFRVFARAFPGTTLLVDTYDTIEGVKRVIDVVTSAPDEIKIGAVRLDSGDLAGLARQTRALLDAAGLREIQIFVSSGLDEYAIAALLDAGAPIDGFGVGGSLGVSADAPSLDIAYKLAEYAGQGRTKLSRHKPILPGRKQVFRQHADDWAAADIIGRAEDSVAGRPLLQPVMRAGRRLPHVATDLQVIRQYAADQFRQLPPRVAALRPADPPYPVTITATLQEHHTHVRERVVGN